MQPLYGNETGFIAPIRKQNATNFCQIRHLSSGFKIDLPQLVVTLRLDGQGRWISFRNESGFYRRCLNGSVVLAHQETILSTKAYEELLGKIHEAVQIIIRNEKLDDQQRRIFQQCLEYDATFYRQQSELYRSVYPEDVPILPPDRYRDLVVQPLIGCPNRACTFCAFYKDKPFRVLTEQQWQMHLSGIERLAGALPGDRDGVLIGSANAMALSQRRLMACLESIEQTLGLLKRGIAAFSDPDYSVQRSQIQWQTLSEKGLVQLVVGLETGWGALRGKLGKAADLSKVYRAVKDYQSAGMSVGLTVLAGVGEVENAEQHRAETCRWIEALNLCRSDKVYVSPLSENGHSSEFALKEAKYLQDGLSECTESRVIPYQMGRFHYYC